MVSRSRIFCARTQGSRICNSISIKWSYQSRRCILYVVPLWHYLDWKQRCDWELHFRDIWGTIPGSLCPGAKDPGTWDSHHYSIKITPLKLQFFSTFLGKQEGIYHWLAINSRRRSFSNWLKNPRPDYSQLSLTLMFNGNYCLLFIISKLKWGNYYCNFFNKKISLFWLCTT